MRKEVAKKEEDRILFIFGIGNTKRRSQYRWVSDDNNDGFEHTHIRHKKKGRKQNL